MVRLVIWDAMAPIMTSLQCCVLYMFMSQIEWDEIYAYTEDFRLLDLL